MADRPTRYSRRSALSPDYTDPEAQSAQSGVTDRNIPRKGSRKAAIAVGLLAAVVVGFLVTRMPFLAGSLNAGAPVDDMVTGSVETVEDGRVEAIGGGSDVDVSSSMPTPNELTPSTVPAADCRGPCGCGRGGEARARSVHVASYPAAAK